MKIIIRTYQGLIHDIIAESDCDVVVTEIDEKEQVVETLWRKNFPANNLATSLHEALTLETKE